MTITLMSLNKHVYMYFLYISMQHFQIICDKHMIFSIKTVFNGRTIDNPSIFHNRQVLVL